MTFGTSSADVSSLLARESDLDWFDREVAGRRLRRLSSVEAAELALLDPRDVLSRGRARAMLARARGGEVALSDRERAHAQRLADMAVTSPPESPLVAVVAEARARVASLMARPAPPRRPSGELSVEGRGADSRVVSPGEVAAGLSAADLALVSRLPVDPRELDEDGVDALRQMEARAATDSERRLVAVPLQTLRREADRALRRAQLALAADPAVRDRPWLSVEVVSAPGRELMIARLAEVVADAVEAETPALTRDEAVVRARAALSERAAAADSEFAGRMARAQAAIAKFEETGAA